MTADSDDVADTADRKPKGSIRPPTKPPIDHPTGEEQAKENQAVDPPA